MSEPVTVLHVVGARPNFMKIAPLLAELEGRPDYRSILVHTGQHYDREMSAAFFADLEIPTPDHHLSVGSASHAVQTAGVMTAIEPVLEEEAPALVLVVGDVNSTLAAALTAVKLGIPVGHVEAGLRSGDRSMPEEINRLLTDQIADLLLTPSRDADENLRTEGIAEERIHFVGNIMIDTLLSQIERARQRHGPGDFGLEPGDYVLATLHRPSNVEDPDQLGEILQALEVIAAEREVVLPLHPRTRKRVDDFGLEFQRVRAVEPVGYLAFLALQAGSAVVLTDSGGVQEETTVLGVPCLTLRSSTERPITIDEGTNRLVPVRTRERIVEAYREAVTTAPPEGRPEGWDGRAARRIVEVMDGWLGVVPTAS